MICVHVTSILSPHCKRDVCGFDSHSLTWITFMALVWSFKGKQRRWVPLLKNTRIWSNYVLFSYLDMRNKARTLEILMKQIVISIIVIIFIFLEEEPPRPQSVSLLNLIYDRFLPCDSPHARRQLQRRRWVSFCYFFICVQKFIFNIIEILFFQF